MKRGILGGLQGEGEWFPNYTSKASAGFVSTKFCFSVCRNQPLHLPFRQAHTCPQTPLARKMPKTAPERKAPPSPSLPSSHPHPNHPHTTPERQNLTSPQQAIPPQKQNINAPVCELWVILKRRCWPPVQNHKRCLWLCAPPPPKKKPWKTTNIYGSQGFQVRMRYTWWQQFKKCFVWSRQRQVCENRKMDWCGDLQRKINNGENLKLG